MEKKTDLRIIKTYAALHDAFTKLLSKKSFEEITVNELCDEASIRRTTFYKHFSDKYDYFNFFLDELFHEFRSKVSYDVATHDPATYAARRIRDSQNFIRSHKNFIKHITDSNMISFFYRSFQKQMENELEALFIQIGQKEKTPKLEALIAFYSGAMISLVGWWLEHPDTLNEDELSDLLVNALSPSVFS